MVFFLPHLSSFFGLLFSKVLSIERDLLAYFLPSVFHSFPRDLQLAVQRINWQVKMMLRYFLLQHFYGNFIQRKSRRRVSRAALGEGGLPATMLFQVKFVLALLHQNELSISHGKDIFPFFKGKKRSTLWSGSDFFVIMKKDKQTLWLASIVRTAAVSWHSSVSPHVSYVVCLL